MKYEKDSENGLFRRRNVNETWQAGKVQVQLRKLEYHQTVNLFL